MKCRPEDRSVEECVCWGGGRSGKRGRTAQSPSGGWWEGLARPAVSLYRDLGKLSHGPLTLFLRRNKVNLLRYSIPLAIQFFLLLH